MRNSGGNEDTELVQGRSPHCQKNFSAKICRDMFEALIEISGSASAVDKRVASTSLIKKTNLITAVVQ